MTYDEFIEQFKPIKNWVDRDAAFDGMMFETYGAELAEVEDTNHYHVWTVVDSFDPYFSDDQDTNLYIIPGMHYVNRFGYFITEFPWNDEDHANLEILVD